MKLKILIGLIILTGSIIAQDSTRVVKLKTYWNVDAYSDFFYFKIRYLFNFWGGVEL